VNTGENAYDRFENIVVDDEADIRGLLKEILSEEGYDVESRRTQPGAFVARDAGSRLGPSGYLDARHGWHHAAARMVGPDGYDCPVVMMSGHGTVETAVEATRLGAFDFRREAAVPDQLLAHRGKGVDAGRRKRLSARTQGSALAVPIGKAKITQTLREQVSRQPRAHLRSCSSRAGVGTRGLRPYLHS